MEPAFSQAQLSSIEEEVRVLKASLALRVHRTPRRAKTFAQLAGLWKGKTHFSYAEIQAGVLHFNELRT